MRKRADGSALSHRCAIELAQRERLLPGDERVLWLQVWSIPELDAVLVSAAPFTLTEGQVVTRGTVLMVQHSTG